MMKVGHSARSSTMPSFVPLRLLLLSLVVGIPAALLRAEPEGAGEVEALPLLSDYQTFWNLQGEAREKRHRIDYEAVVLFHDPGWAILWLENNGEPFFMRMGDSRWVLKSGDLLRVQGVVHPGRGYVVEGLTLTVVGS